MAGPEDVAQAVYQLYTESEDELLRLIARRTLKGGDMPNWLRQKLAEVGGLKKEAAQVVSGLAKAESIAKTGIREGFDQGVARAVFELRQYRPLVAGAVFGVTNKPTVNAMTRATVRSLRGTYLPIIRSITDGYRSVVYGVSTLVTTGVTTRLEASAKALERFAKSGITGFKDKAGRQWNMGSYAEMAVRTSTAQASVEGHIETLVANGHNLVIVSNSPEECPMCRPWEGKVLKLNSDIPGPYPTVDEAIAGGLFHPNCTHRLGAYIEGLTKPMEDTENPMGYEDRQRDRYNERMTRYWKRREALAVTDKDKAYCRGAVKEWQKKKREFVKESAKVRQVAEAARIKQVAEVARIKQVAEAEKARLIAEAARVKPLTLKLDYPENLVPKNAQVLIDRMESGDNREVGRKARKEEKLGEFSDGFIDAVKRSIQLRNTSNIGTSTQSGRIDRILNIRDTSGRAVSRKSY